MQPIKYTKLTDDFFRGMRNPLTSAKLDRLAKLAEQIPLIEPLGTFINDEHYLQALHLVLESTAETKHRGYFLIKEVMPRIKNKRTLLDVGIGNGEVLKWLGRQFTEVHVIDNNLAALNNLNTTNKKILRSSTILKKIPRSVEATTLPTHKFDLAILSHILYYIDKNKWMDILKNIYSSLKIGGIAVIILSDGHEGKKKLMHNFGNKYLDFDDFIEECSKNFGTTFESFVTDEVFHTKTLAHMLHIAAFFLLDIGTTTNKEKLEEYINTHYLQKTGNFLMTSQQKILLLTKHP